MLGVAAKQELRHIAERMARGRADAKAKGQVSLSPEAVWPSAICGWETPSGPTE